MLHVGRCGSTVLADMLGQHPRIYWDGKIHRAAQQMYGKDLRNFDYRAWTRNQFAMSGDRYYGFEFKILADQYPATLGVNLPEFLDACRSMDVTHYLILRRRNTLKHVVSHYASIARGGKWHVPAGGQTAICRFALDLEHVRTGSSSGKRLVEYLEEVDVAHDELARHLAGEQVLEIDYESDIERSGPQRAFGRTCEFLSIPLETVAVRNEKVNPYGMRETLENFAEVECALGGTRFEWMLHDASDSVVERSGRA